jgi:hypothetical protein
MRLGAGDPVRLGYLNVQGLGDDKFRSLCELIPSQFDILFVAETWYINQLQRVSCPLVLACTENDNIRANRRQTGGLLCLVALDIRSHVSVYSVSPNHLTINVSGHHVSAVYLQPSLPDTDCLTILNRLPLPGTIVGDINVRFGVAFNDHQTGPSGRLAIVEGLCQKWHLAHLIPTRGKTRVDHVFTSLTDCEFSMVESPVPSDHDLVFFQFAVNCSPGPSSRNSMRRFYLKKLDCEDDVRLLRTAYGNLSEFIGSVCDWARSVHFGLVGDDAQDLVDSLDEVICEGISACCEQILGSYSVGEAQLRRDCTIESLARVQSHAAAVRIFKRSCRVNRTILEPRDQTVSVMEEVQSHFRNVYSQPDESLKLPTRSRVATCADQQHLFQYFSAEAIMVFVRQYSNTKSCGADSIHNRILQVLLCTALPSHLECLFRVCLELGRTPRRWNTSLVFPLPKRANAKHIDECRPISLTSMLRRAFEGCLHRAMRKEPSLKSFMQFHATQGGFTRGNSTLLHACMAHDRHARDRPLYAFIDLRQAYDRVPIGLLLTKLRSRGAPVGVIALIESLFTDCHVTVVVNGLLSEPIALERGLLQGSLLAPVLFNCFIDDLAEQLNVGASPTDPFSLMFADDIALMQSCPVQLQRLLDIVSEWVARNGMEVGITKCAVVGSQRPFLLSDQVVPAVTSYKYLGFPFGRRGILFEDYLEALVTKARNFFWACRSKGQTWPEWVKLCIFKVFIRPILEYGGPLISKWIHANQKEQLLEPMEDLYQGILKWILPSADRRLAAALLAIPAPQERYQGLGAMFVEHLHNMNAHHPARHLLQHWDRSPVWSPTVLLPRLARDTLYRDLHAKSRVSKRTARTELRLWYLDGLKGKSKLSALIKDSCRVRRKGADRCIYIDDSEVRRQALLWRSNSLGFHWTCLCGSPFTRSHINRCLRQELGLPQVAHSVKHYCALDDMLNEGAYPEFQVAVRRLNELLNGREE